MVIKPHGLWLRCAGDRFLHGIGSDIPSFQKNNVSVSVVESDNVPFWESIKLLFINKYWVIILFAQLLINMMYTLYGSTGIYYTKYILGIEDLIGIMGAVGLVPVFLGFVMVGPMIKKFGLARTARIGMIFGIVASLIRCFKPYNFIFITRRHHNTGNNPNDGCWSGVSEQHSGIR
ncbi:MFS transporter [Paenibacillus sp. UASWS1643]|uniref:MFS transporter n=1 Tax=Paenibacillus sp. UASWS1643 TaxID=2580422 RepID=UPI001CC2842F|nr:MFS transporter [Paenibacillus sp. UASWS1643]